MTPISIFCAFAGLSHREASLFLNVRPDTVKSWSSGRNSCPAGPLSELKKLIRAQQRAADHIIKTISESAGQPGAPDVIEIGYPADDHEAQSLGWPCVGAWRGMIARVLVHVETPVTLVPRGSTPATAAAADANDGPIPAPE